jgi:thymidylate synthase
MADSGYSDIVHGQTGSDGRKGWPVAVRDRIAYFPEICSGSVAVTFLWTMRDAVLPKLAKANLAIAANFYTPAGLEGMIRNLLGNPCIRKVVMFGDESSSRSKDAVEKTSANAIRAFFEKGVGADRRLGGFESAVHIDGNIPIEMIEAVRKNVELIDLNRRMPDASLDEKIAEANRIISSSGPAEPFLERPATFPYEESDEPLPFGGGPMLVRGETIPKAWVEMMNSIYRYGRENLMNANTDRWVKEINNMVVVVSDPQNMDLSFNPFLVPLTRERIEAYKREILSAELPAGKAYTYGNKLRAYRHPSSDELKNLVGSREYRDFEFGRGAHLDSNVSYLGETCEINQVRDIIDVLRRDAYSKACVAVTWHVQDELMRKHKSSPCLVFLQALFHDDRLNLTVFFRSHDMAQGWPENAYGCAAIQKEMADAAGMKAGMLTIISGSAQIYRHYYQQVREMLEKFRRPEDKFDDAKGNFSVEVAGGKIVARLVNPSTGKELGRFEGATPKDVYKQIDFAVGGLRTDHAMYVGTELQKAYMALKSGARYEQDAELDA